jgi:hypothetical protein
MSTIKNVGELRALIAELPDDMPIEGVYSGDLYNVSWYMNTCPRWYAEDNPDNPEEMVPSLTLYLGDEDDDID